MIEEWASLGIGAGILTKAKIAIDNKKACPLVLKNGKPATFSYERIWIQQDVTRRDMLSFIEYLTTTTTTTTTTTVPVLIKGESGFAVAKWSFLFIYLFIYFSILSY